MENLREIIEKHITQDIELLSVKIDSSSSFIKVVIDSANDISVDKTATMAKEIKNNEDILSNFPHGVRLEVGTPGIGSRSKIHLLMRAGGAPSIRSTDGTKPSAAKTCLLDKSTDPWKKKGPTYFSNHTVVRYGLDAICTGAVAARS